MRIGDVAGTLGISRETIRRLEHDGVVMPLRDRAGHRRFTEADLERIRAAVFQVSSLSGTRPTKRKNS
jgi:excisionase family DNA binding protein